MKKTITVTKKNGDVEVVELEGTPAEIVELEKKFKGKKVDEGSADKRRILNEEQIRKLIEDKINEHIQVSPHYYPYPIFQYPQIQQPWQQPSQVPWQQPWPWVGGITLGSGEITPAGTITVASGNPLGDWIDKSEYSIVERSSGNVSQWDTTYVKN